MKEIYIATGIETVIILIIAIIVNQVLHRLFTKIKMNFLTPILNIFIVIWFLFTYREAINKLSQLPNVHFPLDSAKLFMIANIIAGVLIFLFSIQSIRSLIHLAKTSKTKKIEEFGTEELPMFKPGIDITEHEEKEYPLPSEIAIEPTSSICDTKPKEVENISSIVPSHDEIKLPIPNRQKLKRRNQ